MFDVQVVHATITSIDRARCEQSGKSGSFLATDEVIQSARAFEPHIFVWSFQHSITLWTSFTEASICFSSGCAEETDGEQGTEHTAVTNDVAARLCASGLQLQRNIQFRHVFHEMFVSKTHQMHFSAKVYDHRQKLGLITCNEHRKFLTNHITSGPSERCESCCSARVRGSNRRQHVSQDCSSGCRLSEFALLFTKTRRPSGAVSDDDESGGDVNTTCAETASGHNLAQCGGFTIFPHFAHRSLPLFAFSPLPLDFVSDPLCENLHLSPRAQVTHLCGRLWHPFPPQPSYR